MNPYPQMERNMRGLLSAELSRKICTVVECGVPIRPSPSPQGGELESDGRTIPTKIPPRSLIGLGDFRPWRCTLKTLLGSQAPELDLDDDIQRVV